MMPHTSEVIFMQNLYIPVPETALIHTYLQETPSVFSVAMTVIPNATKLTRMCTARPCYQAAVTVSVATPGAKMSERLCLKGNFAVDLDRPMTLLVNDITHAFSIGANLDVRLTYRH